MDYLGIFDDAAQSMVFDDSSVQKVITNIQALKDLLPGALAAALAHFPGVDRRVGGWEGLQAAQACLPDDATRDAFAFDYSMLSQLWEAISPDPVLSDHVDDYRWLTDVYESVKPTDNTGALVWHALGAKTVDLINENVHVEVPRDDLDTIVLDADLLEELADTGDTDKTIKEVEIKIAGRIARHGDDPVFRALGERLQALKEKYAAGQQASLDFLRELLELARDTVAAERAEDRDTEQVTSEERGKAALTELFQSLREPETPIIVERLVEDIDKVVRTVRYEGWQHTTEGDKEVARALRKTLYVRYKIRDDEVFQRSLEYVREYY